MKPAAIGCPLTSIGASFLNALGAAAAWAALDLEG
jgi:hypothetical protein